MLTLEKAAAIAKVRRRFFVRHCDELPFIKRLSPKRFAVNRSGLLQWFYERERGVLQ